MRSALALATFLALCAPAAAQQGDSPYGICGHLPNETAMQRLARSGLKWVRLDFNWFQLEPAKGQFNWTNTDRVVRSARANGVFVFVTLARRPTSEEAPVRIRDQGRIGSRPGRPARSRRAANPH